MRTVERKVDPTGHFTGHDLMDQAAEDAREDSFGYFGTMQTNRGSRRNPVDFEVGESLLGFGVSFTKASIFLRSRMGRHLADQLTPTGSANLQSVGEHVAAMLDWFDRTPE